uniref:ATPase, P-type (Transporting), HAD superfamily, subfamily IC n=1 Tax=Cyanothece sp. (strain PCC 7425 / ATCC 29141) TaxID=395961 RepID=B8HWM1_CYAP4
MIEQGLTEEEVLSRRKQGLGNQVQTKTSRSYLEILRQNVFTFMNCVLFAIGLILTVLGRPGDAVVSVGVVLMNAIVGVVQESRSKQQLDQISLLTRPTVTAIRSGEKRVIDPAELVVGDVLLANPGDQIVVDGSLLSGGPLELDESLLTGESDLISKKPGDPVYSGSYCVSGSGLYRAEKVGMHSLAQQLTASARQFRQVLTPLQQEINLVLRLLLLLVSYLWGLLSMLTMIDHVPLVQSVQMAAVIGGLVPNGLFFMITVAYALGAVRMVKTGALVQQMNAVESLSYVNVLCLDKTGTLTANQLSLDGVFPLQHSESAFKHLLGSYAASQSVSNRTSAAITSSCSGKSYPLQAEVPFSSERKWSALTFAASADPETPQGTYVLGAPEILQFQVGFSPELQTQLETLTQAGLRVILFAYQSEPVALDDAAGHPQLPDQLVPLGLVSLRDQLRPRLQETLQGFIRSGVQLKIISGDNPYTVAALVRQAGLGVELAVISGLQLAQMERSQFQQAVVEHTIFGRISPQQKAELIATLRQLGYYTAMIGDGVNDVMSLKQSQVGIAMQSGSAATRGVADIVLLDDSFAALLPAVREGQRIVRGIQVILKLFLTRILYMALLIISVGVVNAGFPFAPKSNSLLLFLTVGIPPLAIATWARPAPAPKGLIRSILHFVLPATLTLFIVTMAVYVGYRITANQAVAQSALTTTAVLSGLLLIPFAEPPTRFWVGGSSLSGDWRPTLLALAMLGLFIGVMANPMLRHFFELVLLDERDYVVIVALVTLWAIALRFTWRQRLLDRFLNVDLRGDT